MHLCPLLPSTRAHLLLLSMLLPGVGLAAEDAPRLSQLTLMPRSVSAEEAEPSGEKPERWRAPRSLRVLAGVGGGTVAAVGLGAVGALGGLGLCTQTDVDPECFRAPFLGAFVGALAGYPLGVWGMGEALGGDGRLWATMLGAGLGFAAGMPIALSEPQAGVLPLALTVLGAHIGYEVSQRTEPSPPKFEHARFQPVLSVSDRGGLIGLSGRF